MVASRLCYGLPSTGYVHLSDGYTAEYYEIGQGPPIVAVPGLAGGVALLEPLVEELSKRFRVISYEIRGEGDGLFQRFRFSQFANDLNELIGALRLERPGLVGVSFGGAIALDYASRYTNLSFLALQGAGNGLRRGLFADVARRVLDRFPVPSDNPFINQFFSVLIGSKRRSGDQFDFVVSRCWGTDQSVIAQRLAMLDDFDCEGSLANVRADALVLAAENDVLVGSNEAKALARQLPRASFRALPGAGHLAFVTHPTQFANELVETFA